MILTYLPEINRPLNTLLELEQELDFVQLRVGVKLFLLHSSLLLFARLDVLEHLAVHYYPPVQTN